MVTSGECNDYSPVAGNYLQQSFSFLYAESISSVVFVPTQYSNREYSEDGTGTPLESEDFASSVQDAIYQTPVLVTAGINGSCGTARDFNNKFGSSIDEQMLHTFQVMSGNNPYSHTPLVATNQNFWITGTLIIESTVVSNNFVIGA